ncbi:MAG: glycoside hydrolase family 97 protein [Bacteroidota bacterium]
MPFFHIKSISLTRITSFLALFLVAFTACQPELDTTVKSPNGKIEVVINSEEGKSFYEVKYNDEVIISPSSFSFELQNGSNIEAVETVSASKTSRDSQWELPWGEIKKVKNKYNELTLGLKDAEGRALNWTFRVFDDGVGFRYELLGEGEYIIDDEKTEFNMSADHKAWWIPADYNSYEYLYSSSKVSEIDASSYTEPGTGFRVVQEMKAAHTPITLEATSGTHISIHEAALTNYPGMVLKTNGQNLVSKLTPNDRLGHAAKVELPFSTPWRTIQIADSPGGLLESTMILNLNEPNALGDVSWVNPMKYVGIWWEMHLGTHTWHAGDQHGATTERAKRLIDFASEHGFMGMLVEGWNTGWEVWTKPERVTAFDFTTSYPDFDIEEVVRYGKEKGVGLIGHHETSAVVDRYESRIDTAMAMYRALGLPAIKTGYVGMVIPEGEYHHTQWMVNHFESVIKKAAAQKISIVGHEVIKPTGKRRTYPNFLSRESVRGSEYNSPWGGGNPPEHLTIIPFTRQLGGPIDYTPGIFQLDYSQYKEQSIPEATWNTHTCPTTLAYQLASYVIIYSPVQMASDLPENYEGQAALQFIKDVPVDWDEFKVLDAKIGDYVVIARRQGDNWFIGAVTDENERELEIDLSFLDANSEYTATVYADAPDAHYETNPMAYEITSGPFTSDGSYTIKMAAGGGQAISVIAN